MSKALGRYNKKHRLSTTPDCNTKCLREEEVDIKMMAETEVEADQESTSEITITRVKVITTRVNIRTRRLP